MDVVPVMGSLRKWRVVYSTISRWMPQRQVKRQDVLAQGPDEAASLVRFNGGYIVSVPGYQDEHVTPDIHAIKPWVRLA